jgi:hypothetical protein
MHRAAFSLVALTLWGCAPIWPKPGPDDEGAFDAGEQGDAGIVNSALVRTTAVDGGFQTVIDATNIDAFVALDLDSVREVPFTGPDWDVAFRRQRIRTNGGVDGDGGVEVAPLPETTLEAVTAAPATGYLVDQPDGDDGNTEPDTVFENAEVWYDYDSTIHVLTPRPVVYVVKSTARRVFKVHIASYYDEAGTPSIFTLQWAELPP